MPTTRVRLQQPVQATSPLPSPHSADDSANTTAAASAAGAAAASAVYRLQQDRPHAPHALKAVKHGHLALAAHREALRLSVDDSERVHHVMLVRLQC